jgi:hypothetical protein
MAGLPYEDVPVSVRTSADGGSVAIGVLIEGGFFPFHWMPAPGFADDVATIALDVNQYAGPPKTEEGA